MKTPKWFTNKGLISSLLLPISYVYLVGYRVKYLFTRAYKSRAFVICIGNATVGGGGKTPSAIWFYEALSKKYPNKSICFLTKGYKGTLRGPVLINKNMSVLKVGDEPLILCEHGATIVSKSRKKGLKFAERDYDIVILDDGYQNASIYKDFNVLVVYGGFGFGNKRLLPSGSMRESLNSAINKADVGIMVGKDEKGARSFLDNRDLRVLEANYEAEILPDSSVNYVAFAGLAINSKFFNLLRDYGLSLLKVVEFPDHYNYSTKDIDRIILWARENNSRVITTSKDYKKISDKQRGDIIEFKIKLNMDFDVSDIEVPW